MVIKRQPPSTKKYYNGEKRSKAPLVFNVYCKTGCNLIYGIRCPLISWKQVVFSLLLGSFSAPLIVNNTTKAKHFSLWKKRLIIYRNSLDVTCFTCLEPVILKLKGLGSEMVWFELLITMTVVKCNLKNLRKFVSKNQSLSFCKHEIQQKCIKGISNYLNELNLTHIRKYFAFKQTFNIFLDLYK